MSDSPDKSNTNNHTPGILSIHLGWSYKLNLPDTQNPEWRKRWRPYAIAEYDEVQLCSETDLVLAAKGSVLWQKTRNRTFRFEVSEEESKELVVLFFARDRDADAAAAASSGRSVPRVISLGMIKLDPFSISPGLQNIDVQDGTGTVDVEISYVQKEISPLGTWGAWRVHKEETASHHGHVYVKKQDSERSYGMEIVDIDFVDDEIGVNIAQVLTCRSGIKHPFIAPLQFALISDGRLKLLSPLAGGGYLFHCVQKERRLGIDRARYYAAEMVCILEYLHGRNIILGSLRIENILLDSSGHVSLCKPSLFGLQPGNGDSILHLPGASQYPAPEGETSRAGDWWRLGIILYEILTGSPPFCHKNDAERRRRILHHDLRLPGPLTPSARDILTQLLIPNPAHRLGANGIAEVKAHPFFHGLDWDQCIRRQSETPFKPYDEAVVFWREYYTYTPHQDPEPEYQETDGLVSEKRAMLGHDMWIPLLSVPRRDTSNHRGNEEWELTWEPYDGGFCFKGCVTGERILASSKNTIQADHPTDSQKEEALAAALESGYSKHVFSQLLGHGVNLRMPIFKFGIYRITPLEWAVEYERLDLVHLFLDHGADASFPPSRDGPALVRAVRQKYRELVEVLVRKTDRVACTRALALAVEKQDIELATILLASGVSCNFEESDRPPPVQYFDCAFGETLWETLKAEDLTPPLVRAARLGHVPLVKLLLEHGADVNAAYHEIGGLCGKYMTMDWVLPANFRCGRAVLIAMEMGHVEVVRLLIDAGADIYLPLPVWQVPLHNCLPAPRAAYLEIMDGLEAVVAERGEDSTVVIAE